MDMYTIYICSIYIIYIYIYILYIIIRTSWFWWTKQVDVFLHLCFLLRMPFVYVGQINCERQKNENKIYTTPPLIPGSPTYIGAEILQLGHVGG